MKKLALLLASAIIAISSISFAQSNSNDVLQTVPGASNNHTVVADASDNSQQTTSATTTKTTKHHATKKKCVVSSCHCKCMTGGKACHCTKAMKQASCHCPCTKMGHKTHVSKATKKANDITAVHNT